MKTYPKKIVGTFGKHYENGNWWARAIHPEHGEVIQWESSQDEATDRVMHYFTSVILRPEEIADFTILFFPEGEFRTVIVKQNFLFRMVIQYAGPGRTPEKTREYSQRVAEEFRAFEVINSNEGVDEATAIFLRQHYEYLCKRHGLEFV